MNHITEINVLDTRIPLRRECFFFGAIGSIIGGNKASKTLSKAYDEAATLLDVYGDYSVDAANKAARNARGDYRKYYNNALEELLPYSNLGEDLLGQYKQTLTPGSKWYDWRVGEGEKTVNRMLASRGLYGSGEAASEMLRRMNTQLSAEEEQSVFDRLYGGVNLGYNAAGTRAGLRQNKAAGVAGTRLWRAGKLGDIYEGTRQAKFAGLMGLGQQKAQGQQNLWSGIGNNLDMAAMIAMMAAGGGGAGATGATGVAGSNISNAGKFGGFGSGTYYPGGGYGFGM